MRAALVLIVLFILSSFSFAVETSFNPKLVGTWKGKAPIKNLCSGGRQDKNGNGSISLRVLQPDIKPGKSYTVELESDWGCFSKMKLSGFIFGDELWVTAEDRMTFAKLELVKDKTISGNFRFDLNGRTLKMDFKNLKKVAR